MVPAPGRLKQKGRRILQKYVAHIDLAGPLAKATGDIRTRAKTASSNYSEFIIKLPAIVPSQPLKQIAALFVKRRINHNSSYRKWRFCLVNTFRRGNEIGIK